ncbi:MAG TPA: tryptophan 2,3-dioxygenase family protein [Chloroflexota bacterium]|nr:tryptophan 2,3-dioxygenase family protein [Chloroflexota bacterium]
MGETEYEQYLRTDELLRLQKPPEARAHPDELQFQVVHQVSELWMKLIAHEIEQVSGLLESDQPVAAAFPLERANTVLGLLQQQLTLLRTMSPWSYHAIRRTLGHGSGMDSPGYRALLSGVSALWRAFEALLGRQNVDLETVYVEAATHPALFRLAEGLISYDEGLRRFQYEHLRVTQRTIGLGALGTGGTAVQEMERGLGRSFMPALWEVRDRLTARAGQPGE